MPSPGPGDRAPQAQGQEVARRQYRERSQGIGGLERLHGSDEGVLQNSERVADEQALLRHGLCLWVFAEFCKDRSPLQPAVYLPAMSDPHYENEQDFVVNLVNDPVVPHSDAVTVLSAFELFYPARTRVIS